MAMGILNMFEKIKGTIEVIGSKLWLINFYRDQLIKFGKLGLGKKTEHDVKITKELILTTQKRLEELSIVYDIRLTPQAN